MADVLAPDDASPKSFLTAEVLVNTLNSIQNTADNRGESSQEKPAPKKRGRKSKAQKEAEELQQALESIPAIQAAAVTNASTEVSAEVSAPPKRKRGRPRKNPLPAEAQATLDITAAANESAESVENTETQKAHATPESQEVQPPKRKRGRPRKNPLPEEAQSTSQQSTPQVSSNSLTPLNSTAQDGPLASQTSKPAQTPPIAGDTVAPHSAPLDALQNTATPEQKKASHDNSNKQVKENRASQAQENQNLRTSRRRMRKTVGGPANEPTLTQEELQELSLAELREKAGEYQIDTTHLLKKDLVRAVYEAAAFAEGFRFVDGILDIQQEGYAFLRTGNYMQGDTDAFVHQQIIRQYSLRPGDRICGTTAPSKSGNKYPPVQKIESINGHTPEEAKKRPRFRDLTPIYPCERLTMEHGKDSITGRAIDLVAPIGKGQRGLIVSPPKAGKTTILKKICQSIAVNNPEVHLFCLLVDERPEEVTDMRRSIKGTVVASTFDMPASNHTAVAELVIEHAKRLVEMGEDVVVVLDSITRLARAYNLAQPASGRVLSGGVDSAALYPPKKFLGAARNIENGGSLTILASALIDTGSKMDEVIFEEFKGTGNMELKLDRDLADRRIFPAIDPVASGTRNEDLLIDAALQPFVWGVRRILANMNNTERAATALVKGLQGTKNNEEFLIRSAKKAQNQEL